MVTDEAIVHHEATIVGTLILCWYRGAATTINDWWCRLRLQSCIRW